MEELISKRIKQAIQEKVFPGCVVGVVRRNGGRSVWPFGRFTYNEDSPLVQEDSIFDVASITKAIPTSSLALKLIDEGKLKLDDKLIEFVPEFRNSDRDKVLIKYLLTQTLDFAFHLSTYKNGIPEEILKRIFTTNLKTEPGKKFAYTNTASILLGLVAERIFNDELENLGAKHFFAPLEMDRTTFWPLKIFDKKQIVPTENDGWREGEIQGVVHDESAYVFAKSGKAVGSAGLFSTTPDLLNFLEMLLNEGKSRGRRYLSPGIIKLMHTNQLEDIGACHGLGWELYQPRYMGQYCTEETFGKTGFTGCVVICDIGKGVGIAMLSNTTYPKRKPLEEHIDTINTVRRDIADIVFSNS